VKLSRRRLEQITFPRGQRKAVLSSNTICSGLTTSISKGKLAEETWVIRSPGDEAEFDGTFEGTRRRQYLLGLELDYAGRLRWLEAKMSELRELQGKAGADTDSVPVTR
jgi:hypothetical protein